MSGDQPAKAALRHVEGVAAHGYLLNAIAHDLNNLLTNLMLSADQIQYGGGDEAVQLLLEQCQRIHEVTRAIQRLGQRNMAEGVEETGLGELMESFCAWRAEAAPDDALTTSLAEPARVKVPTRHLVHVLSLLADATRGAGPLSVSAGREDVRRSSWSDPGETVPMAVLRMKRGAPSGDDATFKSLVDGFFAEARSVPEIAMMAAWEVVRKQRGRLAVRGRVEDGGVEVTIQLPVVEAS